MVGPGRRRRGEGRAERARLGVALTGCRLDPCAAGGRAAGEGAGGPRRADTSPLSPSAVAGDAAADVEVVLPRRVRPDAVHLPPPPPLLPPDGLPGPRRRRRPRAPPAAPRPPPGERALLLHLPAFGRDLYLQLRRDLRFLSRGFEVEEAGEAWRRGRPAAELCFYSGRVLGHPGSLVSISTCGAAGGLVLPPIPAPSPASAPQSVAAQGVVPLEGWGWQGGCLGGNVRLQGLLYRRQRGMCPSPPGGTCQAPRQRRTWPGCSSVCTVRSCALHGNTGWCLARLFLAVGMGWWARGRLPSVHGKGGLGAPRQATNPLRLVVKQEGEGAPTFAHDK